jgi:cytochrome c biogenesis protein CcmG/thiol:disulfide interchange protein DsbE
MIRWLTLLPVLAMAALAALFGFYALKHDPHVDPHALVGKPMPDLTLARLQDGTPLRLRSTLAEGPVVVNFFASWCGPCEEDHPALLSLQARGVRIIGIDYEDVAPRGSPGKALAFLARLGNPFAETLADPDGRAGIDFGITGVPETYLVAPSGKILIKYTGPMSKDQADKLAAQALTSR